MNAIEKAQGLATTTARVIIGIIFFAHGWQKFFTNGIDGVISGFGKMDIPFPTLSAWVVALAELVGGAMLILGIGIPAVAAILIIDMLGAIYFDHAANGFFNQNGGYEFPLALIAGLIAVAIAKPGIALDSVMFWRKPTRQPTQA